MATIAQIDSQIAILSNKIVKCRNEIPKVNAIVQKIKAITPLYQALQQNMSKNFTVNGMVLAKSELAAIKFDILAFASRANEIVPYINRSISNMNDEISNLSYQRDALIREMEEARRKAKSRKIKKSTIEKPTVIKNSRLTKTNYLK